MSTKKTTKTTKTTNGTKAAKRSATWNEYFKAAITGMAGEAFAESTYDYETDEAEIVDCAATMVRRAEKIADIAEGRNAG